MNKADSKEGPLRWRSRKRARASVAITVLMAATATGCVAPAPPVWQGDNLDACQKGIESEAVKLEKKISGALKKCMDLYRQAVLESDPLGDAATACDATLEKVLTFPDPENKSAMAKAKAKLDGLTSATKLKCSDDNLVALGHAPVATLGDLWSRLILVQRLKAAIEGQTALVGDTAEGFSSLASAGCSRCASIASQPCIRATCRLVGSEYQAHHSLGTVALPGDVSLDACANTAILGSDLGLFSGLKQTLDAGSNPIGQTVCVRVTGARGYIAGVASPRASVDIQTCQDHVADDGNECPGVLGAGAICAATRPDVYHPVSNAGACVDLNSSAPAPGTSFLMAGIEISVVCNGGPCGSDNRGPDATACTDDDTALVGRVIAPFTTASADTRILDADTTDGNTVEFGSPISGASVSIDPADRRFDGTWVSALPGLHTDDTITYTDNLVQLTVVCD